VKDGGQQGGDQGEHDGEQKSVRQVTLGQPDEEAYDPVSSTGGLRPAYPLLHLSSLAPAVVGTAVATRAAFLAFGAPAAAFGP
jgi:hypothetical protein